MAFWKTDDVSQKKKTKSAFTFNLVLYPWFKKVFLCDSVCMCAWMCYCCALPNACQWLRQLYLISINGRTVQEGHQHTRVLTHANASPWEGAKGDNNWDKLEEMMEGTGRQKEEWERQNGLWGETISSVIWYLYCFPSSERSPCSYKWEDISPHKSSKAKQFLKIFSQKVDKFDVLRELIIWTMTFYYFV